MTESLPQSVDEMKDILDIEPVLSSAVAYWIRVGVASVCILLALCALYALYRYIKKRRAGKLAQLSPYDRALRELESLRTSRYFTDRDWPSYYFRLTEVFKHFVSGHCHIDILESTTNEILKLAPEFLKVIDEVDWDKMKLFLLRSDEIKFAKTVTTPTQAGDDFDFVEKFVRNASPVLVVDSKK